MTFDTPTPGGSLDVPLSLSGVQPDDVSVMVAVTDVAGNTTTATAKGLLVTSAPTGTMTLNGGSATTYDSLVTLDSQVVHAVEMRTSGDQINWTAWRPYEPRILMALPGLPGVKSVWVQYRNSDPNVLELSASVTRVAAPLAGGGDHSLITKSDASLWATGSNSFGQLGDGTTGESHNPLQVGGDSIRRLSAAAMPTASGYGATEASGLRAGTVSASWGTAALSSDTVRRRSAAPTIGPPLPVALTTPSASRATGLHGPGAATPPASLATARPPAA